MIRFFTLPKNSKDKEINLRAVSTSSSDVIWAGGSKGTILRSINGGETWSQISVPGGESLEFRSIKAFDDQVAYVMSSGAGKDSRIYKTNDGGKNWQLQLQGKDSAEFFDCMSFSTCNDGMVLGDPVDGKFKVYVTHDGEHWQSTPGLSMPKALDKEGAFAASGSCLAVQGKLNAWFGTGNASEYTVNNSELKYPARIFYTQDKGETWKVVDTPIMQSQASGIFSVDFLDEKIGVSVGGNYQKVEGSGNIAFTEDGGLSWRLSKLSPQPYWSAVAFTPNKKDIMLVGPKSCGLIEKNSPDQWKKLWNVGFNAVSFWKDKAILVGSEKTIAELDLSESSSKCEY